MTAVVGPPRAPQLITYPDSFGGTIPALDELLAEGLAESFPAGVHLLPPFPSTGDRGFAPTGYDTVEPRFGSWADLAALARRVPVTLDVMVNHISRRSPEFRDFVARGRASTSADMFMRPDKVWSGTVWPDDVPDEDLARLFLRRPGDPFLEVPIDDGSGPEVVWATFGTSRTESEQIDLDWRSPATQAAYDRWFAGLAGVGVAEVRLDAVGYLAKEAGTSCFMVEPAIWHTMAALAGIAGRHGLAVLPEVHDRPESVRRIDDHGYVTYDFVLPGLMLDALRTGRSGRLVEHLDALPESRVTMLDCHDGVPVQPDLVGVLPTADLAALTDWLLARGANLNRLVGARERGIDLDAHQINIAWWDAAGGEDGLAVTRAVQLFAPGRPQVYYQGLLGGPNDQAAVDATGEGRAVNRRDYDVAAVRAALEAPAARRQLRVIDVRARHEAFRGGRPRVEAAGAAGLRIRWEHGTAWCGLEVDLAGPTAEVSMSPSPGLRPGSV